MGISVVGFEACARVYQPVCKFNVIPVCLKSNENQGYIKAIIKFNSYCKLMLRLSDTLAYKKNDQNPISSHKICTLSSKRVMRIKMTINMGYDKESFM